MMVSVGDVVAELSAKVARFAAAMRMSLLLVTDLLYLSGF